MEYEHRKVCHKRVKDQSLFFFFFFWLEEEDIALAQFLKDQETFCVN